MKLELVTTNDGSHTFYRPDLDEQFHSKYGAIQESMHIFINAGLKTITKPEVCIFEVGFGTGLNVILSLIEAEKVHQALIYDSLEKFPIAKELILKLNYVNYLPAKYRPIFYSIHNEEWNKNFQLGNMSLTKYSGDIRTFNFTRTYHIVYFDMFAPDKEPELWSSEIFSKIFKAIEPDGFLITYSVKGIVRRRLQDAGFSVEKLDGPPGKRQILKARK